MAITERAALGAALLVATVAAATGCESLGGSGNPDAPLWVNHPGTSLAVTMRRRVTAEARKSGEAYERGRPELDIAHRRVFVGSSDFGLYALRVEDGETLWRFDTLGAVQCEPLYEPKEDVVYFGSNDGALYKVRAVDGELIWRFATNAEVARRPVLEGGTLYAMNANDTLVAVDPATGKLRWQQHRTPAFGMEVAGYAGPAVAHGKVYAAFSDGVVLAYDQKDGSEQWAPVDLAAEVEQAQGGDPPRYLDVDTTPIPARIGAGQVVFVGSYAGGVFALDAADGTRAWVNDKVTGVTEIMLWHQPAHAARGSEAPTVPAKTILVAASGLTGLWGLDPDDGRTLWRRNLPEGGISSPVPVAGALLVTSTRYGIFLFSPLDGAVIDGIDTGGGIAQTPAAYGTRAFMLTNEGYFLTLHIEPPKVARRPGG
jgi:outer membrane protein assembly factor BamB